MPLDPLAPITNTSSYVFPRSVPADGIVTVLVANLIVFFIGACTFLYFRKKHPAFFYPQSTSNKDAYKIPGEKRTDEEEELGAVFFDGSTIRGDVFDEEGNLRPVSDGHTEDTPLLRRPESSSGLPPPLLQQEKNKYPNEYQVNGFFNWISVLLSWDNEKAFKAAGIDAYVYLVFMQTCIGLYCFATLLSVSYLIPVNIAANTSETGFYSTTLDNPKRADTLWLHTASVYLITIAVIVLVARSSHAYLTIRKRYKKLPLPNNYTVKVSNIPPHIYTSPQLMTHLQALWPDKDILSAHLMFDLSGIEEKYEERLRALSSLESANLEFQRYGKRPVHKLGFEGWWGEQVDSLEYFTEKIREIEKELEVISQNLTVGEENGLHYDGFKPIDVGFITFRTLKDQNQAIREYQALGDDPYVTDIVVVEEAPHPDDIIWTNLAYTPITKWISLFFTAVTIIGIIFFWGIPIGFLCQFANLYTLVKVPIVGPYAIAILDWPEPWLSFFIQFLPSLILLLFICLVVPIFRFLTSKEKVDQIRIVQSRIFTRYYIFLIFNTIFLFAISSHIVIVSESSLDALRPEAILDSVGKTFPGFGAFYIDYILNFALTSSILAALRVWDYIVRQVLLLRSKNSWERAQTNKYSANALDYCSNYAQHLHIVAISLSYSSIVPLILPATLLYFVIWYYVDKYNLMLVNYRDYDMRGLLAPQANNFLLIGLIIFQVVMFAILGIAGRLLPCLAVIPLPIVLWVFAFDYFKKRYEIPAQTLEPAECLGPKSDLGDRFVRTYLQPPLRVRTTAEREDQMIFNTTGGQHSHGDKTEPFVELDELA